TQSFSLLEVKARGLQLCPIEADSVAHVVGIDLQRFLVLQDRFVPVLLPLFRPSSLIGVEAHATECQCERDCCRGHLQSIHHLSIFGRSNKINVTVPTLPAISRRAETQRIRSPPTRCRCCEE